MGTGNRVTWRKELGACSGPKCGEGFNYVDRKQTKKPSCSMWTSERTEVKGTAQNVTLQKRRVRLWNRQNLEAVSIDSWHFENVIDGWAFVIFVCHYLSSIFSSSLYLLWLYLKYYYILPNSPSLCKCSFIVSVIRNQWPSFRNPIGMSYCFQITKTLRSITRGSPYVCTI